MRKYIKPELEFISFNVNTAVMNPTASPAPTAVASVVSVSNMYVDKYSNKAWTSVDSEDWTWSE